MSKLKKISVVALLLGSILGTTFSVALPNCSSLQAKCQKGSQWACDAYDQNCGP